MIENQESSYKYKPLLYKDDYQQKGDYRVARATGAHQKSLESPQLEPWPTLCDDEKCRR